MAKLILAHDLGTTGNKATLFDEDGTLISSEFFEYQTYFPEDLWVEQDADSYWEGVVLTTNRLLGKTGFDAEDIVVLSFSGQMMGALPVDKDGKPLNRILIWADRRGVDQVRELSQRISADRIYQITGHRLSSNYSLAKILWIREHLPEVFSRTHKFLLAKDYIIWKLTGRWVTDYSDASGTNLFDITTEEWSDEILNASRLDTDMLPDLFPSTEVVGEVTSAASEEVGLRAGTPVVVGGGDGPCAAAGAGVVREGKAYCYLGSSSWIALASPHPVYDPQLRTFTFHHLEKGWYMPTGTMQAAGGSLQWCRDALCEREKTIAPELGVSPYELMDLEAGKVPAGSEELLFLPYIMGERAPWWNPHARGCFVGLTPRHRKPHLIRSVMEGIGFNLRIILDAFREQGVPIEEMRLIGGGARGAFWSTVLSNIFGLNVLRPYLLEEATSFGAALAGGVGVGLFKNLQVAGELVEIHDCYTPQDDDVAVYERLYPLFKMTYLSLEDVFERLAGG